jgi:hypothetical protein
MCYWALPLCDSQVGLHRSLTSPVSAPGALQLPKLHTATQEDAALAV